MNFSDKNSPKPDIVFITGGSGFIGSRIIKKIIQDWKQTSHPTEKKIRALVRESSDLSILEHEFNSGFLEFAVGALDDEHAVHSAMTRDENQIRVVIHSAAQGGDWGEWDWFYRANYLGTKHVIDNALRLPNLDRLIYMSTVDVYSSSQQPRDCDESVPITINRRAHYSKTKAMAEKVVLEAYHTHRLPVTIFRVGVVYGAGSYSWGRQEARILARGHGVLIDGAKYSSGVIHVDDIVSATLQCMTRGASIGRIYNLADNFDVTWRDWYNTLADGLNLRRPRLSVPRRVAVLVAWLLELLWWLLRLKSRPLLTLFVLNLISRDQLYPTQRVRRDLDWQPRVPFSEGMKELLQWLKEHPELWQE
jgi:nucleoside-diphosphate-sugar epimerase